MNQINLEKKDETMITANNRVAFLVNLSTIFNCPQRFVFAKINNRSRLQTVGILIPGMYPDRSLNIIMFLLFWRHLVSCEGSLLRTSI